MTQWLVAYSWRDNLARAVCAREARTHAGHGTANRRKRAWTIVLAAAALALSACTVSQRQPARLPVDAGNPVQGFAFAQHTCAACHAIRAGDLISPNPQARSFDAIANTPGMTRTALNAWLHSAHTNMPDFIVDSESSDDLHAYLMTLRRD